ncbi:hypothetical protein [Nostoc sp. DSM 114159]
MRGTDLLAIAICAQKITPSTQSTVGHLSPLSKFVRVNILKLQYHASPLINRQGTE